MTINMNRICIQSRYLRTYCKILDAAVRIQKKLSFAQCILIEGQTGCGKRVISSVVSNHLQLDFIEIDTLDIMADAPSTIEKRLKAIFAIIKQQNSGTVIYMPNIDFFLELEPADLARVQNCINECLNSLDPRKITFIASTNNYKAVYKSSFMFHKTIHMTVIDECDSEEILEAIQEDMARPINIPSVVKKVGRFQFLGNIIDAVTIDLLGDTNSSVNTSPTRSVVWSDVGGHLNIKQEIIDTIQLSMEYPQLSESGLCRTGILLHGPPGTGKTLLARAVANECGMHFINIKGPELINMYIGQSEENIRTLFVQAKLNSPSIVFFDELDSIAPNRGQAGDSGGVMDRLVSQFLAELDDVARLASEGSDSSKVFVIGATNRVDLIDPSLLRPGRFDKVLEVTLPNDTESRLEILNAQTRRINLTSDVNLEEIELRLANRRDMSGADFQSLCSRAVQHGIDRFVRQLEESQQNSSNEIPDLQINSCDFEAAILELQM